MGTDRVLKHGFIPSFRLAFSWEFGRIHATSSIFHDMTDTFGILFKQLQSNYLGALHVLSIVQTNLQIITDIVKKCALDMLREITKMTL